LFEQFKALEFELKMNLQIKKKKRKEKEKKHLWAQLFLGTACLPPPVPPLPFHLSRGLALSPTLPMPYPTPALGCHV